MSSTGGYWLRIPIDRTEQNAYCGRPTLIQREPVHVPEREEQQDASEYCLVRMSVGNEDQAVREFVPRRKQRETQVTQGLSRVSTGLDSEHEHSEPEQEERPLDL